MSGPGPVAPSPRGGWSTLAASLARADPAISARRRTESLTIAVSRAGSRHCGEDASEGMDRPSVAPAATPGEGGSPATTPGDVGSLWKRRPPPAGRASGRAYRDPPPPESLRHRQGGAWISIRPLRGLLDQQGGCSRPVIRSPAGRAPRNATPCWSSSPKGVSRPTITRTSAATAPRRPARSARSPRFALGALRVRPLAFEHRVRRGPPRSTESLTVTPRRRRPPVHVLPTR